MPPDWVKGNSDPREVVREGEKTPEGRGGGKRRRPGIPNDLTVTYLPKFVLPTERNPLVKRTIALLVASAALGFCALGWAHFQVILPETANVTAARDAEVPLELLFTHPMEQGPLMQMDRPQTFGVLVGGKKRDLLGTLKERKVGGKSTWRTSYEVKRPGSHVFYLEPAPYWEPAEGKMIVHYTKLILGAFGDESGWDELVGLPVEIEPLVRPYGLWAGNVFRGVVRRNGEPAPFAEIEVEYWNAGGKVEMPDGSFVTQVIKADANGTFCYAMPRAGWWGFAALVEGDETLTNPEGKKVPVELGGLIWVRCEHMN